jgi:hypothetical protein
MLSVCAEWDSEAKSRDSEMKNASQVMDGDGESMRTGEDSRLRVGLGTAGLASGLSSSHSDGF